MIRLVGSGDVAKIIRRIPGSHHRIGWGLRRSGSSQVSGRIAPVDPVCQEHPNGRNN
jgi:hypothetical protein